MRETSAELFQKAAGYMLAAANASKKEMNQKPTTKTIKKTTKTTTTTIIKPIHFKK